MNRETCTRTSRVCQISKKKVRQMICIQRYKMNIAKLQGKLLNVREASHKQIMENKEICDLVKITGLQYKKKYESMDDIKSLR